MQVLAAKFTVCENETCTFPESTHLFVSTSYVPLENGKAIAVSYTWGEFDRQPVLLGHDEGGGDVSMVLGREWNRLDVIETLLRMAYNCTETAMPFWIDQLCIPQDSEAVIRATLSAIPAIFNIFDAIALLPGSPCKCLSESIEQYGRHQLSNPSHQELANLSIRWAQKMELCVNSISFCSYFERVWTRQEMMYTRKMRVEWTGSQTSQCITPSDHEGDIMFKLLRLQDEDENEDLGHAEQRAMAMENDLAPFARQTYQEALSSEVTHAHALARVKMKHDKAWHNSVLAFEDFLSRDIARTQGRYFAIEALCQFLLGVPLEFINKDNEGVELSDEQKLRRFASRLRGVGWVQRRATRMWDYVAAVWIDCPRYEVPEGYKDMALPLLLEDAILQMERNFNVTVPVTAFSGLFGCPSPSAFWRPTWYLPKLLVTHTQDVYGPVVPDCRLLSNADSQGLPLNVYRPGMGRSKDRILLSDFVRGRSAEQILELIHHVVMRWPNTIVERIQSGRKTEFSNPQEGLRAGIKTILLKVHPVMKELYEQAVEQHEALDIYGFYAAVAMIETDIEQFQDVVFELVCESMGLPLRGAIFRKSLPVILSYNENPAIGISRQEWPGRDSSLSQALRTQEIVTVCRDDMPYTSENMLVEAGRLHSESGSEPTYTGVGIWVPQTLTPWKDVAGVTVQGTHNALLS